MQRHGRQALQTAPEEHAGRGGENGLRRRGGLRGQGRAGGIGQSQGQVGDHGQPHDQEGLDAAVADAVGQGGEPGGAGLQNEAERQKAARLLEEPRRQSAVEGVEPDISGNHLPQRAPEDHGVDRLLQPKDEEDEGPGSRQKGGPAPAPAAEGEHHPQGHQQGHEDDGDKDDDGRYWHGTFLHSVV